MTSGSTACAFILASCLSVWRCPVRERDRQTLRGKKPDCATAAGVVSALPSNLPTRGAGGHSRFGRGRGSGTARRFTVAARDAASASTFRPLARSTLPRLNGGAASAALPLVARCTRCLVESVQGLHRRPDENRPSGQPCRAGAAPTDNDHEFASAEHCRRTARHVSQSAENHGSRWEESRQ